jgi:hypothetical protein
MRSHLATLLAACVLLPAPVIAGASPQPAEAPTVAAVSPAAFVPVDPALVEQAVSALVFSWNTPALDDWLAPDFPDRDRLLLALAEQAPITARLQLLGLGGVLVLEQVREGSALVSLVRATGSLLLEYQDPALGHQRREGRAEFVLRLRREVPRR